MPRVILLPVTGTPADAPVFATALTVARLFDGHLIGLHVRRDVQRDIASLASADMGMSSGLESIMTRMEEDADKNASTAESAWRQLCTSSGIASADHPGTAGVTAEWRTETGDAGDWLAEYGRAADLIVVGYVDDGGIGSDGVVESALMHTGKPVLLAGTRPADTITGTVAIAWKDTREAAGAVTAALEFIRRAGRVIVLTVSEDPEDDDKTAQRLAASLRWHNPNVGVRIIRPEGKSAVGALLGAVTEAGCGLLVMGGYGHTRLREAVFGGFTRSVLEHTPLPVLISH